MFLQKNYRNHRPYTGRKRTGEIESLKTKLSDMMPQKDFLWALVLWLQDLGFWVSRSRLSSWNLRTRVIKY